MVYRFNKRKVDAVRGDVMIKYLSLFSGIGAFEKALTNLKIPYELINYCDIDKYASKSYSLIHGIPEDKNLWDITKIDETTLPKDIDLITYGFPCQDISLAGKQKGLFDNGEKTRSGLFFDALRIIEETKPKYTIAENVKNLVSKKFRLQFMLVLKSLEKAGYNNYWKVLNAKDYGIPQNRERVFIVSIRKDTDKGFTFPNPLELSSDVSTYLEKDVDQSYFISDRMIDYISAQGTKSYKNSDCKINCSIARPLTTSVGKRASTTNYVCDELPNDFDLRLLIREATKKGYVEAYVGDTVNLAYPSSKTRRGRVGKGVAQTLTTSDQQGIVVDNLKIRYFTPKERFRLMGFDDEDYEKVKDDISVTQLRKQTGNSIVVNVLMEIFKNLCMEEQDDKYTDQVS